MMSQYVSICLNTHGRSPTQSLLFTSKSLRSMDVRPSFLNMFNGMKVCLALGLNYVELFAGSLQCFWEVAWSCLSAYEDFRIRRVVIHMYNHVCIYIYIPTRNQTWHKQNPFHMEGWFSSTPCLITRIANKYTWIHKLLSKLHEGFTSNKGYTPETVSWSQSTPDTLATSSWRTILLSTLW